MPDMLRFLKPLVAILHLEISPLLVLMFYNFTSRLCMDYALHVFHLIVEGKQNESVSYL